MVGCWFVQKLYMAIIWLLACAEALYDNLLIIVSPLEYLVTIGFFSEA